MSVKRSPEMVLVGYFLSRCGRRVEKGSLPPTPLATDHWNRAYAAFFDSLAGGRTLRTFSNSLKNARDLFDSRFDSGRVGWRQMSEEREPLPLTSESKRVFDRWQGTNDDELWKAVACFVDADATTVTNTVLNDALAELGPDERVFSRTEGGLQVVTLTRAERNPRLRHDAIRLQGTSCIICGFNYGAVYGDWGDGYIEVHHLEPISSSATQVKAVEPVKDLQTVCANCHRMIHRRHGVVLTTDELRAKINEAAAQLWASRLGKAEL